MAERQDQKPGVINFDEMMNSTKPPRFVEEIRRNDKGEIIAFVLKRNPDYKSASKQA